MKSIRIADDLYAAVQQEGALMTRSIAQQLEYWARLGAGGVGATDFSTRPT